MGNNLKPRQDSFCVHYTTIGSETYSNGTKAAIAAGYSEKSAHVTATQLLKQEAIQKRIVELQAENMQRNMITVDKVLSDLEHDKLMARENRQYSVAKSCTELQGKYLAMFTDRLATNSEENADRLARMTEEEKELARIVQSIRCREISMGRKLSEEELNEEFGHKVEQQPERIKLFKTDG